MRAPPFWCVVALITLIGAAANATDATLPDFRITRAFESYDQIRVTEIRHRRDNGVDGDDACQPFVARWTHLCVRTRLVNLVRGATNHVRVSASATVPVFLPKRGASTAVVPIADPCFSSKFIPCTFGGVYNVLNRTVDFLNLALSDKRVHMFAILGDNFYDLTGELSPAFFALLRPEAKSKFFASVPGNHDFWIHGTPESRIAEDQLGYGYLQFYGQDSFASQRRETDFGLHAEFNVTTPARSEHFFTSFAVGGLAFIGFAGNLPLDFDRFDSACRRHARTASFVFLMGHWSSANMGCLPGMDAPAVARALAARRGSPCAQLASDDRLLYLMGHMHSNKPFPGVVTGFQIAGFGMPGSGEFGFPLIDYNADQRRLRVFYFPLAERLFDGRVDERWNALWACLTKQGLFACAESDLAVVWLDRQAAAPARYDDDDVPPRLYRTSDGSDTMR